MGTQGVRSNISKQMMIEAIDQSDGFVVSAMIYLNCRSELFYKKLQEWPCLKEYLDEKRNERVGKLVRQAEGVHAQLISMVDTVPALAQKSASYILDNQGAHYGYNRPQQQAVATQEQTNNTQAVLDQIKRAQDEAAAQSTKAP